MNSMFFSRTFDFAVSTTPAARVRPERRLDASLSTLSIDLPAPATWDTAGPLPDPELSIRTGDFKWPGPAGMAAKDHQGQSFRSVEVCYARSLNVKPTTDRLMGRTRYEALGPRAGGVRRALGHALGHCADRHGGKGANLSEQADHLRGAVRPRQRQRSDRAHHRAAALPRSG